MTRGVVWHRTAEAVFKDEFPADLQDQFALALRELAGMKKPGLTDTPHGQPFGQEVWKLKARDAAGQWRVVYVRGYQEALYVVNAYHKKSSSGGAEESRVDLKNTRERLYWAESEHEIYLAEQAEEAKSKQAGPKKRGGKR
jgi:phage-related protein